MSTTSFDGAQAKFSKAVIIAVSKPPSWKSPFTTTAADVKNLSFENIFVYNFFTMDERTRYSFHNPEYITRGDSVTNAAITDITGQQVRGRAHFDRVASNMIPSFVRLTWTPPPGFTTTSTIASKDRIDAFTYLGGGAGHNHTSYQFSPISTESFELQQQDYVRITNEYLDMFSFDPDGNSVNNWFAEEIDSTHFQQRLDFLYNRVIGNKKYKNFAGKGILSPDVDNIIHTSLTSTDSKLNNSVGNTSDSNSVVQVYDSALLEDLNFPTWNKALPEDTTVVLNTDYAWSIAAASSKCSGTLLGMQARVRNIKYWQEVLTKADAKVDSEVAFSDILETTGRQVGPFEHIIRNSYPYDIEDLNRHAGQPNLDFRLAGFVIEKTQRVETEETDRKPTGEEDEVRLAYEKFPLIFVPCTPGSIATSYVDAAVNYDKEYDYVIRAVFTFSLDVPVDHDGEIRNLTFHYFINSPHSTILTIETRETQAPPYPRDVWAFHEYYTGDSGCLALHWAFPVAKQRDIAYFAIFRRKSIYEPFQLLQIYDFNYSISDPDQSAREIKAKIFNHDIGELGVFSSSLGAPSTRDKIKRLGPGDPKTMFKDKTFLSDTDYIYTVCAIDAHGQMSNYSTQLRVRLNSQQYKLDVRQVSPPGAPLVLPNFFIKGKAFEDVGRTANYKKAILRFRPDYKSVKVNGNIKKIVNAIDKNDGGDESNCYYLQIINPDRANDIVLKYQVNDKLDLSDDPEALRNVAGLIGIPKENLEN